MKIAMVLSRCHSFGSSKIILKVSDYFAKKGHEVHIFANTCDPLDKAMYFHKIPIISSNHLLKEIFTSLIETLLLNVYSYDITYSQPGRFFYPDICGVHFCTKAWMFLGKSKTMKEIIQSKIEEKNLKKAKKIITVSNLVKKELMNYYKLESKKIDVIYNGVDLNEFNPRYKRDGRVIKDFYGIDNEKVIFFIGNPFSRKGLEYLIKALPLIKFDIKILISGRDNPDFFKKLSKKLNVDDKIIWNVKDYSTNVLPIKIQDIYRYFAAADIFVLPTLYEPFGLVILEAMASGLPVITSELAGAAELIEEGKSGLLLSNPKNPKEIAKKINYLLENDSIRKNMGRNARKVAEKHSWEKTATGMLRVFEEALRY